MTKRISAPASVLRLLAQGAPVNGFVRANAPDAVIDQYRTRQTELVNSQSAIVATAEAEARQLSTEEAKELDELAAEFERLNNEIERRERLMAQTDLLARPRGRVTDPEAPDAPERPARPVATERARQSLPAAPRVTANGNGGFRNFGDFAISVRNANPRMGMDPDRRLVRAAALSTYANEGAGADGGFLVPPDFRDEILKKVMAEASLIARTARLRSSSNSVTIPVDESAPWEQTGVRAYWVGEAQVKPQSKPNLRQVTVKAHTLAALVPVTEELLEDAPALDGFLRVHVPDKMDFAISDAIVRGSGVAQPLGFLNAGVTVTQDAEAGQPADTIVAANIVKMFSRMPAASRSTAVWLIHPDAEPQLPLMLIGQQPIYMPPGGLSASPYGTLMGRPVIPHQVANTIGDLGDVMFVDPAQYLTLTKTGQGRDANGLRTDVSIHLWFDQDIVAFRFTMRVGGQPWWSDVLGSRSGTFTQSPFVVLAAR